MKLRKAAAALLAVLLFAALPLTAFAKAWTADDYTFTVPEEFVYTFGPETPENDPSWALAGISDPSSAIKEYLERSAVADLYTEDKATNVLVMQVQSDVSQSVYNLKDLPEDQRDAFLENQIRSQSEKITVDRSYIEIGGQPFFWVEIDGTDLSEEIQEIHEILCGTIFNGHTLSFDIHSETEFTEEQLSLFQGMVNSVKITQILEKPQPQPMDSLPMIAVLVLLVLAVVVPIVYLPVKGKLDKKEKARMAERLSEYHKTHGDGADTGEIRFANATDCTREAVHTFSLYQAYIKNIGGLIVGGVMCFLVLAAAFVLDMDWWLKLLSVAVAGYYVYKIISMPGTVEKVQMKVFQRGVSSTARYAFYDKAFRVSGVQSGNLYPYFQIVSVRRHSHYLYLYYGPDNAYLVDQYGFSLGEFEEFEKFIRQKTAENKGK